MVHKLGVYKRVHIVSCYIYCTYKTLTKALQQGYHKIAKIAMFNVYTPSASYVFKHALEDRGKTFPLSLTSDKLQVQHWTKCPFDILLTKCRELPWSMADPFFAPKNCKVYEEEIEEQSKRVNFFTSVTISQVHFTAF